jgi:hypothetical protein
MIYFMATRREKANSNSRADDDEDLLASGADKSIQIVRLIPPDEFQVLVKPC